MADIELVIKISEDEYQMCKSCLGDADCIESAIANGTPLPKGHGRLIDADKLHHCECKGNFSECDTCLDDDLCNLVNEAPTIIEADTESEECGTGEEVIQAYADGLKKGLDIINKHKTEREE